MARNKNEWTHSGVTMTAEEGMYFSKWLNDVSGIYMNTLYPEERTNVVLNWLENHRNNGKEKESEVSEQPKVIQVSGQTQLTLF